jgi:hypothetical protein
MTCGRCPLGTSDIHGGRAGIDRQAALEHLVLDTIETDVLNTDIVDAAIREAVRQLTGSDRAGVDRARDVAREISAIDRELDRLTALVAKARVNPCRGGCPQGASGTATGTDTAQAEAIARPARSKRSARALEAGLRARLHDWRGLLRRNVAEARPRADRPTRGAHHAPTTIVRHAEAYPDLRGGHPAHDARAVGRNH